MPAVELNKAAIEALKAEASRNMKNSIQERYTFLGEDEGGKQERQLLACADVLGVLGRAELDFRDFDHTIADEDKPETVPVEFTEEASEWMRRLRPELASYLDHLDTTTTEGEIGWCREQAFLLHVLDRVLGVSAEREPVKA
jgi:hypothetical protein